MTLARFFTKLRTDSGLSLRALAAKTRPRVDPTVLWKIEKGKPVRAKTLGVALHALGLNEIDGAYIEAFALWSTEQAATLSHGVVLSSGSRVRKSNNREFDRLLDEAATALRQIPETDRPLVIEALRHPEALCLWVKSRK